MSAVAAVVLLNVTDAAGTPGPPQELGGRLEEAEEICRGMGCSDDGFGRGREREAICTTTLRARRPEPSESKQTAGGGGSSLGVACRRQEGPPDAARCSQRRAHERVRQGLATVSR